MKYFVVDAFSKEAFHGNPAGVCIVDQVISDELMQQIAFENNLAETAFVVKREGYYDLRWFTPAVEIDLCGHATLASAYIIMNFYQTNLSEIDFHTKSGVLHVDRKEDIYLMDFPSRKPIPCGIPAGLEDALGVKVIETLKSRDLLIVVENEDMVRNITPNFRLLKEITEPFGFILTARGYESDFVSRFFAPNAGIDEDPVTGSSHCTLIPYWSERLGKTEMQALQLSKRGGSLYCKNAKERVVIGGAAVCYLEGNIIIE